VGSENTGSADGRRGNPGDQQAEGGGARRGNPDEPEIMPGERHPEFDIEGSEVCDRVYGEWGIFNLAPTRPLRQLALSGHLYAGEPIYQLGKNSMNGTAWKAENMLTIWNVSAIFAVIAVMYVISQRMMQPPSIPTEFLAGNSNQEDHGTSVVKVIEKNQLLPSFFLLPITSRSEHSEF
jgi:hypothetical protein